MPEKKQLGQILIDKNIVTKEELKAALLKQKETQEPLGTILAKMGIAHEKEVVKALAEQLMIEEISFEKGNFIIPSEKKEMEGYIPESLARQYKVFPLEKKGNTLKVAISDPFDLVCIDNIKKTSGLLVEYGIATTEDIRKAIESFYTMGDELEAAVEKTYDRLKNLIDMSKGGEITLEELKITAQQEPIIQLVDLILKKAIDNRASDIHIEPTDDSLWIRQRIDGVLYDMPTPPKHFYYPIISRIKVLANIDIAEKRLPQDGTFSIKINYREIDFRVATIPTIYGEKVVLRILDKSKMVFELESLGLQGEDLKKVRKGLSKNMGLVFLAGPTGSGKTTTLYAALNTVKTSRKNILTIEDPVEYKIKGICQTQSHPDIGFDFANGLRAILRQDPDIIMVGEVRDLETASICIRAALTGHIVLSTLHTNTAVEAITRLLDIGIPKYLLSATLNVVISQRLVRVLCNKCKKAYTPDKTIMEQLGVARGIPPVLYNPVGCQECSFTGYVGRVGIFEVLAVDETIRKAIYEEKPSYEITNMAIKGGMKTLFDSGVEKVLKGITNVEEVMLATQS